MQFQITRISNPELPLVDFIPDYGVVQLEGYNGVGKTLTVRVLELCAGRRPEFRDEVWRSFCRGIGRLTVTATELQGARELQWEIDGERLLAASEVDGRQPEPSTEWFVGIQRDGNPATLAEVRELFAVERLAGDVGLVEMLATEAEAAARQLEGLAGLVAGSESLAAVEQAIGHLSGVLAGFSSAAIREHQAAADVLKGERDTAQAVLERATRARDDLLRISEARARLEEIAVEGDKLDARIAEVNAQIAEQRAARDQVVAELTKAEAAAADSEDLRSQLKKAASSYKRATNDVERSNERLAELHEVAGIEPGEDAEARRAALGAEIEALERRRNEIDAGPALVSLVDEMATPVSVALARGLGEHSLLVGPAGRGDWTVADVADALDRRRESLIGEPSPLEAVNLDEQIQDRRQAAQALGEIASVQRRLDLALNRQNEAQEVSRTLSAQLEAAVIETLERLRSERRERDDQLFQLSAERTVLVHRRDALGAPDENEALARQLEQLVKQGAASVDELEHELASAERQVEQEREAFDDVADRARAAAAQFERDVADVREIARRLSQDRELAWLRAGEPEVTLPAPEEPLDDQLRALHALTDGVARVNRRLDELRNLFSGLGQSLRSIRDQLRNVSPGPGEATLRIEEVRASLAQIATSWFENRQVRIALLGPGAKDVAVDLETRRVSWVDDSGVQRSKPLEALSSGEQAFTFTQARLALLREERPAENRLIVLDEFGAFVSQDRMRLLREYLESWRTTHKTDQILVILPAKQDYKALAASATGKAGERYKRMAEQLTQQQWFVEELQVA